MAADKLIIRDVDWKTIQEATGLERESAVGAVTAAERSTCDAGSACGLYATFESSTHDEPIDYGLGFTPGLMSDRYQRTYPDTELVHDVWLEVGCTRRASCKSSQCTLDSLVRWIRTMEGRSEAALAERDVAIRGVRADFATRRSELQQQLEALDAEEVAAVASAGEQALKAVRSEFSQTEVVTATYT